MSILSFLLGEKKKSASVAKERLQLIIAHERVGGRPPADYLPALQKELEAILLVEPANQKEKWLAAPQSSLNETFLTALANFMYWENYDVRVRMDGRIDRVALDDIRKNRKRR